MGLRVPSQAYPQLNTQDITDLYVRNNFQALSNYFQKENQFVGFKHLKFSASEASNNVKISHGLGYIPRDIVVSRLTGSGKLTLNWDLFDTSTLDVSMSGALEARILVGTYQSDLMTNDATPLGGQEYLALFSSAAAAPASTSTTTETTTTVSTTTLSAMPNLVVQQKSSSYVILTTDDFIIANGTLTLTLPVSASAGKIIWVKNIGTGVITISGTIDGSSSMTLTVQNESVQLIANGGGTWSIF